MLSIPELFIFFFMLYDHVTVTSVTLPLYHTLLSKSKIIKIEIKNKIK